MKFVSNIEKLRNEASSQWGLFTAARAQQIGVSRKQLNRMVSDGRIELLCYGTYRFTVGDETPSAPVKAAWLSCFPKEPAWERIKKTPPDAVIAGRTATTLHDAGDFYAEPYTFIVGKGKRTTREDLLFLAWEVDEQDIVFINDLPTTSIERTIADLIRLREDMSLVDDFMQQISMKGILIDDERLATLLSPLAARNGYAPRDGKAFANDLIARNSLSIQVHTSLENLAKALKPLQDQSKAICDIIRANPTIEQLQQSLAVITTSEEADTPTEDDKK